MQPLTLTGLAAAAPDVRPLATIGDAVYFELAIVLKSEGGRTAIVGPAKDWPILSRDATIADLESRLAAAERHAAELEQQLLVQAEAVIPLAVARAATGAEPVAWTAYAGCQQCAADGRRGVVADSPDLPHLCQRCAAAVLVAA